MKFKNIIPVPKVKQKHVDHFTLYYELCMPNVKKKYISVFDNTTGLSHLKITVIAVHIALVVFM